MLVCRHAIDHAGFHAVACIINIILFEAIPVKAVQSILGTKPQKAIIILNTAEYCIVRKSVLNLVMPEKVRLGMGFKAANKQYDKRV